MADGFRGSHLLRQQEQPDDEKGSDLATAGQNRQTTCLRQEASFRQNGRAKAFGNLNVLVNSCGGGGVSASVTSDGGGNGGAGATTVLQEAKLTVERSRED